MNRLITFLMFFNCLVLSAQDSLNTKKNDKFFTTSYGLMNAKYRDFATSPLFYSGPGFLFNLGNMRMTSKWENVFELGLSFSLVSARIPKSSYLQAHTNAYFINTQFYDSWLIKIDKLSGEKYDVKLGGVLVSNFNSRLNPSFQNAGAGIEFLVNGMFSGKICWDISRKSEKIRNLYFIKQTLSPVKRSIAFQLNTGLLNMNFRPGYAYLSDGAINGSDTKWVSYFLSGHSWSVNGWRFGSRLEYTKYKPNGNGIKWSYIWDALNAPGKFESLQVASHSIQFTLMFNKNNK